MANICINESFTIRSDWFKKKKTLEDRVSFHFMPNLILVHPQGEEQWINTVVADDKEHSDSI